MMHPPYFRISAVNGEKVEIRNLIDNAEFGDDDDLYLFSVVGC
jgi:hypothetical protein